MNNLRGGRGFTKVHMLLNAFEVDDPENKQQVAKE